VTELQFQVKGQVYFLALVPPYGELGLFAPTRQGLRRLPIVHDDGAPVLAETPGLPEADGEKNLVN
jgi:hypothetical protein